MWLLLFACVSTVGGVPLNQSQDGTVPVTVGAIPLNDTHKVTSPVPVRAILFNDTHNATTPASGVTVSILVGPAQTSNAETLEELQEDFIVQEGDILIPEDRNAVQTLWKDAVVPYTISDELADREFTIFAAFEMISDVTCIRFKEHTTEMNYLKFLNGKGCASFVGCQGGAQSLYFAKSCSVGNLCHEIIHALGLHHEHTRQDRDQYITVQWQSIMPGKDKNFKVKSGNMQNLPYDLGSIMHYGPYFFSVDGNPTVLANHDTGEMGQRKHLSQLDIQRLNKLYHCDERGKWL